MGSIGANNVTVPGHYYKVIYSDAHKEMIGILMPHQKIEESIQSYVVTVDRIEEITGLDFFFALEDSIENVLEGEIIIDNWSFDTSETTYKKSTNSSTAISNQCKGIAKSTGNRCKNSTKNDNGYCYVHQSQSPGYKKPAPTSYSGRCNATTKAGTRCKRNASSGSRYCWQHQ
jgi:endonuclease G